MLGRAARETAGKIQAEAGRNAQQNRGTKDAPSE